MSFLRSPVIQKTKKTTEPAQKLSTEEIISVPFQTVCNYLFKIESTTKRLEKLEIFTKMLIQLHLTSITDIPKLLLLLQNQIREPWDAEISFLSCGEQIVRKAVSDVFSVKNEELKASIQETGDLAISCEAFKRRQPKQFIQSKKLTLNDVFTSFIKIADCGGSNSSVDRQRVIKNLLLSGSALEGRYLIRFLVGKNRLGLQRKTMIFALSDYHCFVKLGLEMEKDDVMEDFLRDSWREISSHTVTNKIIDDLTNQDYEEEDGVNEAVSGTSVEEILSKITETHLTLPKANPRTLSYMLVSKSFAKVPSLVYISKNINNLEKIKITPFIPILPMLAKPVSSFEELLSLDSQFFCEYKYDGFRAQIHCKNGKLQIYSRSQENMSGRFPDVLECVKHAAQYGHFIIDGEIVPVSDEGQILPFQYLSRRLKVYDASQNASKITFFAFDIMLLEGVELLNLEFKQRRFLLTESFKEEKLFQLSKSQMCQNLEQIQSLLDEAVTNRTEGLIVKTPDSRYAPDRRSKHWTKLKKDYLDTVGDSFDLVPIAGWYGKGKRAGVVGSYMLAAKNGDEYQTVTCIGTGMTDEFLQQQQWEKIEKQPSNVRVSDRYVGAQKPDFWINPEDSKVWEIKVANLSLSLMHTCFLQNGRGIAARLPRLIRNREDKTVDNCTTAKFIFDRFNAQPDREGGEEDEFIIKDDSESDMEDEEELND